MYIRFETFVKNHCSDSFLGIFQVANSLRDSGKLSWKEGEVLQRNLQWLKTHLKTPACLRK